MYTVTDSLKPHVQMPTIYYPAHTNRWQALVRQLETPAVLGALVLEQTKFEQQATYSTTPPTVDDFVTQSKQLVSETTKVFNQIRYLRDDNTQLNTKVAD